MIYQQALEALKNKIFLIRGHQVMLDSDLADLYGVETKQFNRAVRRNSIRFPKDFMFQVTEIEWEILRCQTGTSKSYGDPRGGRTYLPMVFTEQGVAMLSSVLRSERAALVNIEIMRAFVRLRQAIQSNGDLVQKIEQLEHKYDSKFKIIFDAIKQLMKEPSGSKNKIGIIKED